MTTAHSRARVISLMAASLAVVAAICWPLPSLAQEECGILSLNSGPYDYRSDRAKLPGVEYRHFTPRVEALVGGESTVKAGPDIEFTLKFFPNHHRALAAVVRLATRDRTAHPSELRFSVDCHFSRALRFRKNDVVVRMLYANWLGSTNRKEQALRELKLVEAQGNPVTINNLGLVYAELGEYELALQKAHEAQAMDHDVNALKRTLEKAGRWSDAAPGLTGTAPGKAQIPERSASTPGESPGNQPGTSPR